VRPFCPRACSSRPRRTIPARHRRPSRAATGPLTELPDQTDFPVPTTTHCDRQGAGFPEERPHRSSRTTSSPAPSAALRSLRDAPYPVTDGDQNSPSSSQAGRSGPLVLHRASIRPVREARGRAVRLTVQQRRVGPDPRPFPGFSLSLMVRLPSLAVTIQRPNDPAGVCHDRDICTGDIPLDLHVSCSRSDRSGHRRCQVVGRGHTRTDECVAKGLAYAAALCSLACDVS